MSFRASQELEDVHLVMQNPLLLHGAKIALAPQSETNRTWREAKAKHSSLNRSGGLKMPDLPHACLAEVSSALSAGSVSRLPRRMHARGCGQLCDHCLARLYWKQIHTAATGCHS